MVEQGLIGVMAPAGPLGGVGSKPRLQGRQSFKDREKTRPVASPLPSTNVYDCSRLSLMF